MESQFHVIGNESNIIEIETNHLITIPMSERPNPYQTESLNLIYNLLFCDDIDLFKNNTKDHSTYPWNVLFSSNGNKEDLIKIIDDENAESRVQILAGNKLIAQGHAIDYQELRGVIIEVGMDEGLDVIAAYSDGTARYINYSEKLIVLEAQTAQSNALIDDLFNCGNEVIQKIGPWDKARLPFPPAGQVRLTFLVSDGLYFGQGPFDVLAEDPMGGPVIGAAAELMKFLTEYKE